MTDFDAVLVQRGAGYLFPVNILKDIKRPKILLFTELVQRRPEQDGLFSSDVFDKYFVRTEDCKNRIVTRFGVSPEKISIFLSSISEKDILRYDRGIAKCGVMFSGTVSDRRSEYLARVQRRIDERCSGVKIIFCDKFGPEMLFEISKSEIVLNVHGSQHEDTETRVYEVLGIGSLLITEKLSPESPFKNAEHLIEVDSPEAMADAVVFYLQHTDRARHIAAQGHAEVVRLHTYTQRAALMRDCFLELTATGKSVGGAPFENWRMLLNDWGERLRYGTQGLRVRTSRWIRQFIAAARWSYTRARRIGSAPK